MAGDYVGYYRVSTRSQGISGLGLEAQRSAVQEFVARTGGNLLGEFEEVESSRRNERPKLQLALALCRKSKATLVIAKLDRLARNVSFIARLMESRVEFVAADMPAANKLTVHILAAMAEHERDVISQRTRAALLAAKSRGIRLGNPSPSAASAIGTARSKELANEFALAVSPLIHSLRAQGLTSYSALARALTARGVKTRRGGEWTPMTVRNLLQRLA